jgi:hypothetical protein
MENTETIHTQTIESVIAAYRNSELESIQFSLAPGTGIFMTPIREFCSTNNNHEFCLNKILFG